MSKLDDIQAKFEQRLIECTKKVELVEYILTTKACNIFVDKALVRANRELGHVKSLDEERLTILEAHLEVLQ